jgi:hypothetical protein
MLVVEVVVVLMLTLDLVELVVEELEQQVVMLHLVQQTQVVAVVELVVDQKVLVELEDLGL